MVSVSMIKAALLVGVYTWGHIYILSYIRMWICRYEFGECFRWRLQNDPKQALQLGQNWEVL